VISVSARCVRVGSPTGTMGARRAESRDVDRGEAAGGTQPRSGPPCSGTALPWRPPRNRGAAAGCVPARLRSTRVKTLCGASC
jgi:hypothetical protein